MNKDDFYKLKEQWYDDTCFSSNICDTNSHSAVEKFIKAGESILPFIFEDIKNKTNVHWFYILINITGSNPVLKKHSGYIQMMYRDWLIWYHEIYLKEPIHIKIIEGKYYLLNQGNLRYYLIENGLRLIHKEEYTVSYWIVDNDSDISKIKIVEIDDEYCGQNNEFTKKDVIRYVDFEKLDEFSKNLYAVRNNIDEE